MSEISRINVDRGAVDRISAKGDELNKAFEERATNLPEHQTIDFIGTGSSMLNLAGSSLVTGGIPRNRVFNPVGPRSSGKTLVLLEIIEWWRHNGLKTVPLNFPLPKELRTRFNNTENVMDFPVEIMYPGLYADVEWCRSRTIEDFSRDFGRFCDEIRKANGIPFKKGPKKKAAKKKAAPKKAAKKKTAKKVNKQIAGLYFLDSWDVLDTESNVLRADKEETQDASEETGSYNLDKNRYASNTFFRRIADKMDGIDVTLVIVSQVRANIKRGNFGPVHVKSGGNAFEHMIHQECWLNQIKVLDKTVLGEKRPYAVRIKAKFKKNKVAKPFREAKFTILFDHGIDDLESMMTFLYGPEKAEIQWQGESYTRDEFISHIEDNDLEEELQVAVQNKWDAIEEALTPNRKPKYS